LVPRDSEALRGVDYEIEASVQDQAFEEVRKQPTSFVVTSGEDVHAWERANFFFNRYLKQEGQKGVMKAVHNGNAVVLTSKALQVGRFDFEVRKTDTYNGIHYDVRCVSRKAGNGDSANINARNLARFIQTGNLEVSLLVK